MRSLPASPLFVPLLVPLLLGLAQPAAEAGAEPDSDAAFTRQIVDQLSTLDVEAGALFAQADAARALGELSQAGELYGQVTQRVPQSDHAWRRHCAVLQEAGLRAQALPRCRTALELDQRPENRIALAYTLLDVPSGKDATAADRDEARVLLAAALTQDGDDPMNARLRCFLAMNEDDQPLLRACVADLERVGADQVMTGFYTWKLAFSEQRWRDALLALDRAQVAGMPAADADSFRQLTRDARPRWTVWGPALGVGTVLGAVVWLLGSALRRRLAGGERAAEQVG